MTACAFLIPGDISLPTGGYAYDRRVLRALALQGVAVRHVALPGSFPSPGPDDLRQVTEAIAAIDSRAVLLIDGLAYGAMPADLLAAVKHPIVALCHHPLGLETGLSEARSRALLASEQAALAVARHVIVTSGETRAILNRTLGVPLHRITVAIPGTDPAPRARGTGAPLALLAVGSLVPRKGYTDLLQALAPHTAQGWSLTIAGASDRDPVEAGRIRQLAGELGLDHRVSLTGGVDEARLASLYDAADLFAMTSHYEGYGMVLTEAMARGLPIVTTRSGAAAAQTPDAAAIKVAPGDVPALASAFAAVMTDHTLRHGMARASWLAGQQLSRWEDTARIVAGVLKDAGA